MSTYYNLSKTISYDLSENAISCGGEGSVYAISGMPDKVAKIYHENKRSQHRLEKLKAMTKIPASNLPECAWPLDIIYKDNKFCGFVMNKVTGIGNLVDFFVYENRSQHSWKQYIITAANVAAAVNNIHESGIVIGDLKPDNIIIDSNTGKIRIVDTDSYQLRDSAGTLYPCMVATPEYIPPELQNINFEKNTNAEYFTEKTDDFSLAVIIFKLLMNGVHPFACFCATRSLNNLESNIRKGLSPYFSETNTSNDIYLTLRSPEIKMLPQFLQDLFKRAFVDGRTQPDKRPNAAEWFYALSSLSKQLKSCSQNSNHVYYSQNPCCPWCELERELPNRKAEYKRLLNAKDDKWKTRRAYTSSSSAARTQAANQSSTTARPAPSPKPTTTPTPASTSNYTSTSTTSNSPTYNRTYPYTQYRNKSFEKKNSKKKLVIFGIIFIIAISSLFTKCDSSKNTANTDNNTTTVEIEQKKNVPLNLSYTGGRIEKYSKVTSSAANISFSIPLDYSETIKPTTTTYFTNEQFEIDIKYNTDATEDKNSLEYGCNGETLSVGNCSFDTKADGTMTIPIFYSSPCSGSFWIKNSKGNTLIEIPIEIKGSSFNTKSSNNDIIEFVTNNNESTYTIKSTGTVQVFFYYGDQLYETQTINVVNPKS